MLMTGVVVDDRVMSRADSHAHDTRHVADDTLDGANAATDADDDDGERVTRDIRRLFTDSRPADDTGHVAHHTDTRHADADADADDDDDDDDGCAERGTPRLFIDSHASDDVRDDADDDDDGPGCGLFAAAFSNNNDSVADNSSAGNAFFFCPEGFNISVADTSAASDGGSGFPFSFGADANQSSTSDEDNPFTLIFWSHSVSLQVELIKMLDVRCLEFTVLISIRRFETM